jgi:hypothetical protein
MQALQPQMTAFIPELVNNGSLVASTVQLEHIDSIRVASMSQVISASPLPKFPILRYGGVGTNDVGFLRSLLSPYISITEDRGLHYY